MILEHSRNLKNLSNSPFSNKSSIKMFENIEPNELIINPKLTQAYKSHYT